MASVERVFKAVKDIANKDQRGFITPAIFNQFAGVAQMNIFNRMFTDTTLANRLRRAQFDGPRQFAKTKSIQEDLSTFAKKSELTLTSGAVDKPSDFARVISISTVGKTILGEKKQPLVQIVYNEEHIDRILNSDLSAPSDESPVALIGDNIEVFPNTNTSISKINLRYYKLPQGIVPTTGAKSTSSPSFGYTSSVAGVEIYSAANSVDFELPEHYFTEIVNEICLLAGVNLRDRDLYTYGNTETTKDEKQ
tara:strand:+ start:6568 stop:7320 length:753 start_codon:yes stop_codon:yes gene_type:complete